MGQLEELYRTFRNGDPVITFTQSVKMLKGNVRRKRPAFEEWQQRLNAGDKLPRGRYFTGKKPGLVMRFIDEFHLVNSSS